MRILTIKNAKLHGYYFYLNKNMYRDFQICISLTWKVWFSKGKKFFLKRHCAQDGMLQTCCQCFFAWEKGWAYWSLFLTSFSHKLEHHSWYSHHLSLHKNACKKWRSKTVKALKIEKKIMLFVAHHSILISIVPSKELLLSHDKHFFSFKKYYLDTIAKLKLGQQLGRYH